MSHEKFDFEPMGNPRQAIDEAVEDLNRGIYDKAEQDKITTKLQIARTMTLPDSDERREIDQLLQDIEERYGDDRDA